MLTKWEIQNVRSDVLSLPLQDTSNGYEVRDIQGLSPVKASITSSQMAQVDGAQAQSSRRDTRNITAKLGIEPNYQLGHDVDSLRNNLYDFLMPKSPVNINFYKNNLLYAVTSGIVESCDQNMFSNDPEMDISLICYDPDFYAPESIVFEGETVTDTSVDTINYTGSVPAGVIFTLTATRDMTGFSIYNSKPDGTQQKYDFEGQILNGDIVTITSIPLQKAATITRDLQPFSALAFYQAPSDWITLDKGGNDIRVYSDDTPVPYTIEYTLKYGGL